MVLLITQNTHVKYQNTPKGKASFLSFLRLKVLSDCIWKFKKHEYPCGKKPKKRFSTCKKMSN
jgi:hypothetical protein